MYLISAIQIILNAWTINKQQQVKLILTEIPLVLTTGSASCAAETSSLSVSICRKLYDPRKWGFDDQDDLKKKKEFLLETLFWKC